MRRIPAAAIILAWLLMTAPLSTFMARAQDSTDGIVDPSSRFSAGVELDILPYVTGGYFGAVWIGRDHLRLRALIAKVHLPDFIVPDGFVNNEINSVALVGDYFLDRESQGWWVGGGFVLWRGSVQSDSRIETVEYDSYLVNGGAGYAYFLTRRIYASPWGGVSIRIGGDSGMVVDDQPFKPAILNPEGSLKFGWRF